MKNKIPLPINLGCFLMQSPYLILCMTFLDIWRIVLPKFDLDKKDSVEDHVKKLLLSVRLQIIQNEDVVF
jgi:hypothetical protein